MNEPNCVARVVRVIPLELDKDRWHGVEHDSASDYLYNEFEGVLTTVYGLKRIKLKQCLVLTVDTHCFILNDYKTNVVYDQNTLLLQQLLYTFYKLILQKI